MKASTMNKLLFFLSVLCISTVLFAQNSADTLNQLDNSGKKHGYWKKSDRDTLRYEGKFEHGIPVGEFKYYYPSGNIKAKTVYSENGTVANTTMYYSTGPKMAEGVYINKIREGEWINYDGEDHIIAKVNYKNGLKSGECTYYYSEGGKLEIINYENGVEHGNYVQYFNNQSVKMKGTYEHGEFHGVFAYYYPNGIINNTGKYVHNLREGVWSMTDDLGKPIVNVTYKNGNVISREVFQKDKDPEYLNKKLSDEEIKKKGTGNTDNGINDPRYDGY